MQTLSARGGLPERDRPGDVAAWCSSSGDETGEACGAAARHRRGSLSHRAPLRHLPLSGMDGYVDAGAVGPEPFEVEHLVGQRSDRTLQRPGEGIDLGGQAMEVRAAVPVGVEQAEETEAEEQLDGQVPLLARLPRAGGDPSPLGTGVGVGQAEALLDQVWHVDRLPPVTGHDADIVPVD